MTLAISGPEGLRFLSSLVARRSRWRLDVPIALCRLLDSGRDSIDVTARDAEHVAAFVDELARAGWIDRRDPPFVLAPRRGEVVAMVRDVLVERVRREHDCRVWIAVPARMRGVVVDLHRHRAVVDLDDGETVLVGEDQISPVRGPRRS